MNPRAQGDINVLTEAAPAPPTEIRPPAAVPGARGPGQRPRLNRWLQTQSERARTVRALSSAILGTERH